MAETIELLVPYVPRLVIGWLAEHPDTEYRSIDGTCVFADISGFTNLTERLAKKGKVGAEEMGTVLNEVFEQLLGVAYDFGAGLVKWGGDAVLLLFEGDRHVERASRASLDMQSTMARIGRLRTSAGTVRLGMSIGVHTGQLDFLLVGQHFKELIVTGPGATEVARMEKTAESGEVVVSPETARALAAAGAPPLGTAAGGGHLLVSVPKVERSPNRDAWQGTVDLRNCFSAPLREHLLSGAGDYEHRQVTVAFVEFSGTDRLLVDEGPEALTAAVRHVVEVCQEAAHDNDVAILSSDIYEDGGKIILIAGAPRATGDDQSRLLAAVRAVIDGGGIAGLGLRAGINRGRVFAGDYGPSYRRVYSVTGDAVNLAARLMAHAEYGQIVAAAEVVDASRTRYGTEELAPFFVKGKEDPVTAVVVGARVEGAVRQTAALPLFGRELEQAALADASASAHAGRGRVIELVGPAGIGKSRLLEDVVATWPSAVLWADGDVYGRSTPYQPLHRLFRSQLLLAEGASPRQVAKALRRLVDAVAPELKPWLPLIGIAAGVTFTDTVEVAELDRDVRKARLEEVVSQALGLLLRQPTLFIFNDLHFMDSATIDLIGRLADDVHDRPWLLVVTRRPEGASVLAGNTAARSFELGPLPVGAARELVRAATEAVPLPARRVAAITERAGGHPLFLMELAASVATMEADDLPDVIEELIAARIDQLAPDLRTVLRSASVLGMTIDLGVLTEILGVDGPAEDISAKIGADLAEFTQVIGEGTVRFLHHLVRQTAYEGLPFHRRALLHARIADALERRAGDDTSDWADVLSEHSFNGRRFNAAWEYSQRAAGRARAQYANEDAAQLYQRALSCVPHIASLTDVEVVETCEALGQIYLELCAFEQAENTLRAGRIRAKSDPMLRARLGMKTADLRRDSGHLSDALRWVTRSKHALAGLDGDAVALRARLSEQYAFLRVYQGRFSEALHWAQQAADEAIAAGDRHTEGLARDLANVAAVSAGRPDDAEDPMAALKIFTELGDLRGQARSLMNLGVREYYLGQWIRALDFYERAEEIYRRTGRTLDAAMCMGNRAEVLVDQGDVAHTKELLEQALELLQGLQAEGEVVFCQIQLARVDLRTGALEEAGDRLDRTRRQAEALGLDYEVSIIDALRVECLFHVGQYAEALDRSGQLLTRSGQAGGDETSRPLLERMHGEALYALGASADGCRFLRASLNSARKLQADHHVAWALEALLHHDAADGPVEFESWHTELATLRSSLGLVGSVNL